LEIRNRATAKYWLSPFLYRMLDLTMGHGRRCTAIMKQAAVAAGFVFAFGGAASAQERTAGSCAAVIRGVLDHITCFVASSTGLPARADEPGSGRVSGARTSKELPRWPLA
jgi:hypothetical protein